ncbi:general stress protein [Curtobacterium sp. VKM Ac-2922]|uniref:general stress protein n=1 Tax=Curtobacterium sp. VKM Ac-2922 TaxID=2929475 RepID=UPI001FB41D14|nr:general stress protein [Curtobacterium sp. VKM Ac-2922]MCJ1713187.1 ECF transporter S component [Curtobacterium sp. VKM Ac-2922]
MSTQSPFRGRTAQVFPTLPRGDVLGTFDSYTDAQAVVAKLAESDFPVNKLSIVGNDLKTVERVTGKMTYGRAAIAGALSGLWLGIFFGIVLTLFSPTAGGLIIAAAIIGAAFGMLYGIVSFAITKRQRDFTSVHQVLATNYQIIVDPQLVGQAQRILGQSGATPHAAWNPGQQQAPFQGQQPQQQPWRPGPGPSGNTQGSPYGDHATPHAPGGQQGQYGQQAPGQYGQKGPGQQGQYGQQGQPGGQGHPGTPAAAPGSAAGGQPRYGTNSGPRYGEVAQPGQPAPEQRAPQPPAPSGPPAPRPDEAPRYGERVSGATPPAPTSSDAAGSTAGTRDEQRPDEQRPDDRNGSR